MAAEAQALGSQAVVRANIDLNSEFDVAYVTMNALGDRGCVLRIVRE